jgi:uncharacterized protein YigE (DUF2233 family)
MPAAAAVTAAVTALLVLQGLDGAGGAVARAAPPAWTAMAPGADRAVIDTGPGGGGARIQLFRFDLVRFRAEVVVGAGSPQRPETAAELRHRRRAAAAVNGGFFDQRGASMGLRIAAGATRVPLRSKADWGVLLIYPGRARIVHTRELEADPAAAGAVQVGPRILVGGVPPKLRPQRARRTAVALDREGRSLTLVLVAEPIEASELGAALAAAGFETALMLDGGPSTQLALEVGTTKLDIPGAYPVPDLLAVFSSTAPAASPAPPASLPGPSVPSPAPPRPPTRQP